MYEFDEEIGQPLSLSELTDLACRLWDQYHESMDKDSRKELKKQYNEVAGSVNNQRGSKLFSLLQ